MGSTNSTGATRVTKVDYFSILSDDILQNILRCVCSECGHAPGLLALSLTCRRFVAATTMVMKRIPNSVVCDIARAGHINMLQWYQALGPWSFKSTCAAAAEGNQLLMLKWLRKHGCPSDVSTIAGAAKYGHLNLLKWLDKEQYMRSIDMYVAAAGNGHLDVLQWAVETHSWSGHAYTLALAEATYNNQLSVIVWMINSSHLWQPVSVPLDILMPGAAYDWHEWIYIVAASKGYTNILEFIRNKCQISEDISVGACAAAVRVGDLTTLQWFHSNDRHLNPRICQAAAYAGRIDILRWLRRHKYPWDSDTCYEAASSDNFETLKWLYRKGCPWNEYSFYGAATNGNLPMLKWLRAKGCPWNAETCHVAAWSQKWEALKWLHKQGCPWDEDTAIAVAQSDNLEMFLWLLKHNCPWSADVCKYMTGINLSQVTGTIGCTCHGKYH